MAVLVTRPHPDDEATAARLRAKGFEVLLAPMLRFEPVAFHDDAEPLWRRHRHQRQRAARHRSRSSPAAGCSNCRCLRSASIPPPPPARRIRQGDLGEAAMPAALRERVLASVKAKQLKKTSPLLYLAGADLARDLAGELGEHGFTVVTQTTYRMVPLSSLPREVCDAFAANRIEAVLHYSRRSARAFLEAARAGGVEISALALPQCCISAAVASILRDAGATQVTVAASPDENALFEALEPCFAARDWLNRGRFW